MCIDGSVGLKALTLSISAHTFKLRGSACISACPCVMDLLVVKYDAHSVSAL